MIIGIIVYFLVILVVTATAVVVLTRFKEDYIAFNNSCNERCGESNWDMDGQINSSTYVRNLSAPCECEVWNGIKQ